MFHKKAVIFSSAAGTGTKAAIKDIRTALTYWGIPEIYSYGTAVQANCWNQVTAQKKSIIEDQISRIKKKLLKRAQPSVGLKTKFLFHIMRKMQTMGWGSSPEEKAYWEEKGWLLNVRPWNK